MNETSASKWDGNEDGKELDKADGWTGLENVQVLQNVGDGHQTKCTQESKALNVNKIYFVYLLF